MIGRPLPSITCVTATRGRDELIKTSIACYMRQSYPNKSLLILSQGDSEANARIRSHVENLGRDDIAFHPAPRDLSLGAMRNTCADIANGEIICQWDDDDISHPSRLFTQYRVLASDDSRIACAFCDFLKYYSESSELYWCDWSRERGLANRFLCGTVMFYKKVFGVGNLVYPETGPQSKVEEDLNFLNNLFVRGHVGQVFAAQQYVYVYHGRNTYDLEHHNLTLNTSSGKKVLGTPELIENQELIFESLRLANVNKKVYVRGLDGVAFTYDPA